jgi:putative two-component system response regulator
MPGSQRNHRVVDSHLNNLRRSAYAAKMVSIGLKTGELARPLRSFRQVLPIIRHHHEKWDGSGYPDGLKGEQIPLTARILQVTDVYDALTTDRSHRKALPTEKALATMRDEARLVG